MVRSMGAVRAEAPMTQMADISRAVRDVTGEAPKAVRVENGNRAYESGPAAAEGNVRFSTRDISTGTGIAAEFTRNAIDGIDTGVLESMMRRMSLGDIADPITKAMDISRIASDRIGAEYAEVDVMRGGDTFKVTQDPQKGIIRAARSVAGKNVNVSVDLGQKEVLNTSFVSALNDILKNLDMGDLSSDATAAQVIEGLLASTADKDAAVSGVSVETVSGARFSGSHEQPILLSGQRNSSGEMVEFENVRVSSAEKGRGATAAAQKEKGVELGLTEKALASMGIDRETASAIQTGEIGFNEVAEKITSGSDMSSSASLRALSEAVILKAGDRQLDNVTDTVIAAAARAQAVKAASADTTDLAGTVSDIAGVRNEQAQQMVRNAQALSALSAGAADTVPAETLQRAIAQSGMPIAEKIAALARTSKPVRIAQKAEEKIRVINESMRARESKGLDVRDLESGLYDIQPGAVQRYEDVRGDAQVNALQAAGVLNGKVVEAELVSANKLTDRESINAFIAHMQALNKMDAVPTATNRHVVVVAGTAEQVEALKKSYGDRLSNVEFADINTLDREAMEGYIESRITDADSKTCAKKVRGLVKEDDPFTNEFARIVDSLIVSDASFRTMALIYIDHIARQKDKYFTIFTDKAIGKLKEDARKARSSGMTVEVVTSEDTIEEIDESLEASFESDVAF
jgi:hypothetical protein